MLMIIFVPIVVVLILVLILLNDVDMVANLPSGILKSINPKLVEIIELNKEYSKIIGFPITRKFKRKSLNAFRTFNTDKAIRKILNDDAELVTKIKSIDNEQYSRYILQLTKLTTDAMNDAKLTIIKKIIKINSYPITDSLIIINWTYISPQGRNHYGAKRKFSYDLIKNILQELESAPTKTFAQQERSKMSAKLRYQVLKRDNGRCVICGRSEADGVKLHVDHIKPIAKGGKTELDNLRTLCQDCNLGKSADYDEDYDYIGQK